LQDAARDGDGYAQYYVGLMHSRGVGVKKNNRAALDWLGKASLVGITAAESEIARINGTANQGAQLRAQREAERKSQQQQEARRQEEERRQLEAQRQQQEAAAKNKAEQEKRLARQREAESKAAAEEAKRRRLIAQKQAEAEKKRQAILAQRKQKEAEKKTQFESDPCAGKSARFLSTCR
jgi:phage-related minor tail protein